MSTTFPDLVPRADLTCLDPTQSRWMLNSANQTPCQVAERIVQVCSPTAAVQHLSVDPSCSTLGVPATSSCCCTTVTYALVAACWVCQTSRLPSVLTTTYETWLASCPSPTLDGEVPLAIKSAQPAISIPAWAFVQPANVNSTWDMSLAQRAANYTPTSTTSPSIPSSSTTSPLSTSPLSTSPSSASASEPPPTPRPPYAAIAITTSTILLFLLAMSAFLYRRHRQRHRVSSSTPPPPGFLIDDNLSPGLPDTLDQPGRWGWWKRWKEGREEKEKKRKTVSDPGKIDAWRYPFDYTPVSASAEGGCGCAECLRTRLGLAAGAGGSGNGSGSGSGGTSAGVGLNGGGYYDPYPGGSRVTLLLPDTPRAGRRSTETLLPGTRTSPSPVPGHQHTQSHSYSYSHQNQLSPQPAQSPRQHMNHLNVLPNGRATPPSYTFSPHFHSYSQPHLGLDAPRTPAPRTPVPASHSPLPLHQNQNHQQPTAHQHLPTHTHTYELRLSPEELVDLPADLRARIRQRGGRRRHRERGERDRDRDPGARGGDRDREGRDRAGPSDGNRRRSLSVPVAINLPTTDTEPEPEQDDRGGPRNGPELREKYRGRRNTDADTRGDYARGARVSPVRDRTGGAGGVVRAGEGAEAAGGGRALDGGVSLMGGPPRMR